MEITTTPAPAISDVTEVIELIDIHQVNARLSEGWQLLHVGSQGEVGTSWTLENGHVPSGEMTTVYVLGKAAS